MNPSLLDTPWKLWNYFHSRLVHPLVRLQFLLHGISWGRDWRFFGMPIIQKHRRSRMQFGTGMELRSTRRSNPLGPNHPVFLTTWRAGAELIIGDKFGMTGGILCAAESIRIGRRVIIGANASVMDTDFHPLTPAGRRADINAGVSRPIVIEDDVFVGMNAIILKGSHIGRGSVIGAGSVVSGVIPPGVIAAGSPAEVIRTLPEAEMQSR